MKIVWTDNFDRETVSERVVAEGIRSRREGEVMLDALRATNRDPGDPNWYKLVEDDYVLRLFDPNDERDDRPTIAVPLNLEETGYLCHLVLREVTAFDEQSKTRIEGADKFATTAAKVRSRILAMRDKFVEANDRLMGKKRELVG
jgi:hypothetical protein